MLAEGAGVRVSLGAARDLTGVRLLRTQIHGVKHTGRRLAITKDGAFER